MVYRGTSVKNKLNFYFRRWFQIEQQQSKGFPLSDIERKHLCSFFLINKKKLYEFNGSDVPEVSKTTNKRKVNFTSQ